jgi:hypothetical protein
MGNLDGVSHTSKVRNGGDSNGPFHGVVMKNDPRDLQYSLIER